MKSCENKLFYQWFKNHKWSQLPYPGQIKPYTGVDNKAGFWPLIYLKRDCKYNIIDPCSNNKTFYITNPCNFDFDNNCNILNK